MAGLFHAVSKQHNPLGSPVRERGTGRYTFGLALSAGLAGLLYGYDTVAVSGAIDFLKVGFELSPAMEGTIISSVMFGGVFGAGLAGFLSDRFGRRRILMIGAAMFFLASLLSAVALGPYSLIIARSIGGVGIGLTAALAVTYITEAAPTHIRGTLAFSYQMMAICGIFLANILNYLIASNGPHHWNVASGWRWMLGVGAVPAAIFFAAMLISPESPRFLIQKGFFDEGFAVLEHISGTDKARVMADDIADSVRREEQMGARFADLFRPGLRRALMIGIFLAVFNQAVGMNVISYYGPTLFKGLGFANNTEFLASASVAGVELVLTVTGMYLIDAVGRRRLMAVGSALMTLFALLIAYGFWLRSGTIALVGMMLFTGAFAFSMGPIPWVMIPELFPTYLRGRATGICTLFLLFVNWLVAQFTPILVSRLGGGGTFLLFAGLDVVCLIGVLAFVPETTDRTLEDIEADWQPKTPLDAARFALSTADMHIRRAETTLARVENERMAAMGVIEQAERDRVAAQKEIFRLENEERERIERQAQERAERQAREAAAARAQAKAQAQAAAQAQSSAQAESSVQAELHTQAQSPAQPQTPAQARVDAPTPVTVQDETDESSASPTDLSGTTDQAREDAALSDAMATLDLLINKD